MENSTETQVPPHLSFAPEQIAPRRNRALASEPDPGINTPELGTWNPGQAPCVVPLGTEWTDEMRKSHWNVRGDSAPARAKAREMCSDCKWTSKFDEANDVLEPGECLAEALDEERGLKGNERSLVRGGVSATGRARLDVAGRF